MENENIAETLAKLIGGLAPWNQAIDENGDVIPGALIAKMPPEWSSQTLDYERLLSNPRRATGTYIANSIVSFATLYHGLEAHGSPRIYRGAMVDASGARTDVRVEAVMNDAANDAAGWRDLRVVLNLLRTPAWIRWTGLFGKAIPQFKLARILEEHSGDIASPPGADMLKLALELEATRSAQFKGSINLQNRDTGLTFVERTETTIAVPREIVIRLRPYQNLASEYPVPAFLRYQLDEGKVVFAIEPKNWDLWLETIYDDVVKDLASVLGDAVWIDGLPPDSRLK